MEGDSLDFATGVCRAVELPDCGPERFKSAKLNNSSGVFLSVPGEDETGLGRIGLPLASKPGIQK